jgi:hypothetical protein
MKKLLSLFLIGCITLLNVLPVMAETTADTYKGNRVVKYHFYKSRWGRSN